MVKINDWIMKLRRDRFRRSVRSRFPDVRWSQLIIDYNLNPSRFTFNKETKSLYSEDLGIHIQGYRHAFILEGYEYALSLCSYSNVKLRIEGQRVMLDFGELSFEVWTSEQLYILTEVILGGVYNVSFPKPVIMFDIGMNVGYSSALFAERSEIVKVFAFEPVRPTYLKGLENLNANEASSRKVKAFNFGLSNGDHDIEVEYCERYSGNVGINNLGHIRNKEGSEITSEPIKLRDAGKVVREILDSETNTDVAMKIDCEGSEFDVVESLDKEGTVFGRICFLMIEWHRRERLEKMVRILETNGFVVLNLNPFSGSTGMIYAARGHAYNAQN